MGRDLSAGIACGGVEGRGVGIYEVKGLFEKFSLSPITALRNQSSHRIITNSPMISMTYPFPHSPKMTHLLSKISLFLPYFNILILLEIPFFLKKIIKKY